MDFHAEAEKRKLKRREELGGLIEKRFNATVAIEFNQKLIEDLDMGIATHDAAIKEIDQSQRDFEAYKVVEAARGDDEGKTGAIVGDKEPPESEPTQGG